MLLGSEEDLAESKEPIAFPIYGRGCVLYALVGKGINAETIDEACAFLVGPCSCIVKEENPGVDLLVSADWDGQVRRQAVPERALPELTGFSAFLEASSQTSGASKIAEPPPAKSAGLVATAPMPSAPGARTASNRSNLIRWGMLAGMGVLVVLSALVMWRRQKR